jgi:hypothetical protein
LKNIKFLFKFIFHRKSIKAENFFMLSNEAITKIV